MTAFTLRLQASAQKQQLAAFELDVESAALLQRLVDVCQDAMEAALGAWDDRDNDGWCAGVRWVDGEHDVVPVYVVEGPEPFGGLQCRGREHAEDVAAELNRRYGRRPPEPQPRAPVEPSPVAADLAEALSGSGLDVTVNGDVVAVTFGGAAASGAGGIPSVAARRQSTAEIKRWLAEQSAEGEEPA